MGYKHRSVPLGFASPPAVQPRRVLDLEPVAAAAMAIWRVAALRHDAFESKPARVGEYDIAGRIHVLDQLDADERSAQQLRQCDFAPLPRLRSEIDAIEFEQIERQQLHLIVSATRGQRLEVTH